MSHGNIGIGPVQLNSTGITILGQHTSWPIAGFLAGIVSIAMFVIIRRIRRYGIAHTLRFIQELVYRLIGSHIFRFALVTAYLGSTQALHGQHDVTVLGQHFQNLPNVKYRWDHSLSQNWSNGGLVQWLPQHIWDTYRHLFRPEGEGEWSVIGFLFLAFNPVKYARKESTSKIISVIDDLMDRIPIWVQLLLLPLFVTVVTISVTIPMVQWVFPFLHNTLHAYWLEPYVGTHQSLIAQLYSNEVEALLIGGIVGLIVTPFIRPLMDVTMVFLCRFLVSLGFHAHGWMPQGMRDEIKELSEKSTGGIKYTGWRRIIILTIMTLVITLVTVALLASAAYGFWFLHYKA